MSETPQDIWKAALGEIELSLSSANFTTWFKNTALQSLSDGVAVVSVPNGFTKEWLKSKYNKIILRALRNISSDIREVQYVVAQSGRERDDQQGPSHDMRESIALEDVLQQKEEEVDQSTNLNPRYTFDSFVAASSNELAYAAAQSVIKKPGTTYNPLFIYGGVGLGKTHILQAVGNAVVTHSDDLSVLYVSAESFSNDLIVAIENGSMQSFKNKYRKIDVLIIDDVQFIAGKEKTQEEFFQTFNHLYQSDKQIILSSDRPPKAIPTLEERLRSRFEGGMIADINPPDFETRVAILRKKLEEHESDIEINSAVIEKIASTIKRNVRELEGALTRILGYAELHNEPPTLEDVQSILKSVANAPKTRTTPESILESVADFYNVTVEELCNRSRQKSIVKPRQVAMYLLRTELDSSFPAIGDCLGKRDHTTAMYAFNKIDELRDEDESFAQELEVLQNQIYSEYA